ncbi:hypothetical protein JOB18_016115 [Solea senegalensis]|uniref:Uncharacterized protein n=1 Tax=Solea senegalensis TaxID=28829 RepID=A0AAV6SJ45_SOLSE|nr:hypothetical protein JOB18_016115 [Solea senegalensis]
MFAMMRERERGKKKQGLNQKTRSNWTIRFLQSKNYKCPSVSSAAEWSPDAVRHLKSSEMAKYSDSVRERGCRQEHEEKNRKALFGFHRVLYLLKLRKRCRSINSEFRTPPFGSPIKATPPQT